MWKGVNLDHFRSAVQNAQQLVKEGVQEFSAELREGVHQVRDCDLHCSNYFNFRRSTLLGVHVTAHVQVASTDPDRNDDW